MSENIKTLAFETKLSQLKKEEQLILKLLKDVRDQLRKYEVEELQISSELISSNKKDEEESDSDESIDDDPKSLLKALDCAELVNDSSLNLGLEKYFQDNVEMDESDDSVEDEEEDDDCSN